MKRPDSVELLLIGALALSLAGNVATGRALIEAREGQAIELLRGNGCEGAWGTLYTMADEDGLPLCKEIERITLQQAIEEESRYAMGK